MKIAIAYLRASREDQKNSANVQREAIERWASKEGYTVASWHVDQGISGGAPLTERPALLEAISAVGTTEAALLVVAKRDRLARDPLVAGMVDRAVEGHGAKVFSADGLGNGESGGEVLMRRMLDAFAEFERHLIRQRTRDTLAHKKRKGEPVGRPPYGMRVSADKKRLEPNADEQTVIRLAKVLSDTGMTVRAIAAQLNAEGYRNRKGKEFAFQSIHVILNGVGQSEFVSHENASTP